MKKNILETLEEQELIQKLIDNGHGELVKGFLMNEEKCFTKNSARLNKSGACRALGWKSKQLEEALAACREILAKDMALDEDEENEEEPNSAR